MWRPGYLGRFYFPVLCFIAHFQSFICHFYQFICQNAKKYQDSIVPPILDYKIIPKSESTILKLPFSMFISLFLHLIFQFRPFICHFHQYICHFPLLFAASPMPPFFKNPHKKDHSPKKEWSKKLISTSHE
ncbi:hypothetical protein J2Y67_001837 [Neobacillus niacini]|nr:hypothetical protein [Neobacillus niacini]